MMRALFNRGEKELLPKILSLIVAVSAAFPTAVAAAPRENSMTACDFVKKIKTLNTRIVRVRGTLIMLEISPDGATPDYLVGTCPDLGSGIIRVKIAYPDTWFLRSPPKGYRVDKGSFLGAQKIVMSTSKDGKVKDRYIATIAGEAYAPPPPSTPPPGLHVPLEGTYDASLVIEGIYDVEIPVQ